jgi:hypothetical protein
MSNVAFDLEVFKLVAAAVPPPGNATFAALGSIGPDLYQYIPISSKLSDALDVQIQKAIESLTPAQITAHIAAKTVPEIDFSPIIGDIDAPSSCSTPPSWVTSGGSPPSAQQSGPSTGETV